MNRKWLDNHILYTVPLWYFKYPACTIHSYYNVIDYIPYAVLKTLYVCKTHTYNVPGTGAIKLQIFSSFNLHNNFFQVSAITPIKLNRKLRLQYLKEPLNITEHPILKPEVKFKIV